MDEDEPIDDEVYGADEDEAVNEVADEEVDVAEEEVEVLADEVSVAERAALNDELQQLSMCFDCFYLKLVLKILVSIELKPFFLSLIFTQIKPFQTSLRRLSKYPQKWNL